MAGKDWNRGAPGGGRRKGGRKGNPGKWGAPLPPAPPAPPAREDKPQPRETRYESEGRNMWCQECGTVFAGPSRGKVAHTMAERRVIDTEGRARNPFHGGLEGSVCNKKSCIDAHVEDIIGWQMREHPDRDYTEARQRIRERLYAAVRMDDELYPGGLIDDTPLEGSE